MRVDIDRLNALLSAENDLRGQPKLKALYDAVLDELNDFAANEIDLGEGATDIVGERIIDINKRLSEHDWRLKALEDHIKMPLPVEENRLRRPLTEKVTKDE